ncbi:LacI family DNA-binding transcriptional regulator [Pseudonocardia sp. TRM90224]|uniref:LacI family DNA-binding transcriptional regulator n=1 Tax=Pseudonocardia sp. TRM90224 TaxID=2812678 RepID=UPI001E63DEFC|nr:LacI family DNA-binding transcriptional regulator [Pseudonocardia sp. TRM90224]
MVTSRDVARLAGVSQPTVSRALTDHPRVSEATKKRVREAAQALGYSPDAIGRALSVGRSTRVGLVVTDLENQFYAHLVAPLHGELEALGYELVLITESAGGAPLPERVAAHGLCSVVLSTTTLDSIQPARLRDRGVPFVYLNRTAPSVAADSVTVDPEPGLRALLESAIELGHRRIGAVFGPRNTSTGEAREQVTRSILDEHGLQLAHRDVLHGPFDFATGHAGMTTLLDRGDPPTLVLFANDVVALGGLNAAVERGVSVPGEVSVAGFDDLPTSGWALVRLSTVAYDLDAVAREAARLVVARVQSPDEPLRQVVHPTRYVARATVGPPRV